MDQVLIYWKELYLIYALGIMCLDFHCTHYALSQYCKALNSEAERIDIDVISPFTQDFYKLPTWLGVAVELFALLAKGIAWPLVAVVYGIHFMGKGDWE